jgi:hypothetical protein
MRSLVAYKKVLVSLIQVVLFLFLAFGGFLKRVAPPDEANPGFYVGIVSFFVLIILLVIAALARRLPGARNRRGWMLGGIACFLVAIPCAVIYPKMLHKYTYASPDYPRRLRVKGSDDGLTKVVKEWLQEQPYVPDASELVRKFPPGQVWEKEAIERARTTLLLSYAALVLSLATSIFCLLEANAETSAARKVRTG